MSLRTRRLKISVFELTLFALLAAVLFLGKRLFEFVPDPNIHPLAMLITAYTVAFRKKALLPIYTYVLLEGVFSGFSLWWVPYLYIWTVLWGMTMLLPPMKEKIGAFVYPLVCALHGLLFGILYAPAQAILFGLDFEGTVAWIIAGLPFDVSHAIGNLIIGTLALPLSMLLKKLVKKTN